MPLIIWEGVANRLMHKPGDLPLLMYRVKAYVDRMVERHTYV